MLSKLKNHYKNFINHIDSFLVKCPKLLNFLVKFYQKRDHKNKILI